MKELNEPSNNYSVMIGCSTYPNVSESVSMCMKIFNYTQHPNADLLPKHCGKQKSGWQNSVKKDTNYALFAEIISTI